MEEMSVLVASQNLIKQAATEDAFRQLHDDKLLSVDLSEVAIESGVSDQPLSLEESSQGVLNRINKIKNVGGYTMYVAIESGAYKVGDDWYESACAAVKDANDYFVSISYGPAYCIPKSISVYLESGFDLNHAMEVETGLADTGKAGGFNGWLTGGKIDRRAASSLAIQMALYGMKHK